MSTPLLLPVLATKNTPSWPRYSDAPRIGYVDAAETFAHAWPSDAHFAAYSVPGIEHRLSLDAIGRLRDGWPMVLLVVDVDGPGHKREPDWWAGELLKLETLAAAHPGGFFYATRGGYRLVYRLASPFVIRTVDDKEAWRERYRRELLYLARRFAIVGDPACSDITRLFRLPCVIREAGAPPENHPTMGDPAALGFWTHEPSDDERDHDVSTARLLASKEPKAWGSVLRALVPERGGQDGQVAAPELHPENQDEERVFKRAAAYLANMSPSIEGAGGNAALWEAALAMGRGFSLGPSTALAMLLRDFNPRCSPPWPRSEVERACRNAAERAERPWGYLRDADGGEAGLRFKPSERQQRLQRHHETNENEMHQEEPPPSKPSRAWRPLSALVGRLRDAPSKLRTGIPQLDDGWRGGIPAGFLWVVGGAPGAGKTTWITSLAHEWARHGVPVAFIAGDEAREGVLIRLGQQAGIDRQGLEEGREEAIEGLEGALDDLPFLLVDPDDDDGVDVASVADELRARWPVDGPAVLVVDSLQAMSRRIPDAVADSPRSKVEAFMKACKATMKRHQLVIICLSELARGAYRGGSEQTSDLAAAKESGAIEYEAGALCVLRSADNEPGLVSVNWAKSRLGRVEPFSLRIDHKTATVSPEAPPSEKRREGGTEARFAELLELVTDLVRRSPGLAGAGVVAARLERRRSDVLAAIEELLAEGVIENRGGARRPRFYLTPNGRGDGGGTENGSDSSQPFPDGSGTIPQKAWANSSHGPLHPFRGGGTGNYSLPAPPDPLDTLEGPGTIDPPPGTPSDPGSQNPTLPLSPGCFEPTPQPNPASSETENAPGCPQNAPDGPAGGEPPAPPVGEAEAPFPVAGNGSQEAPSSAPDTTHGESQGEAAPIGSPLPVPEARPVLSEADFEATLGRPLTRAERSMVERLPSPNLPRYLQLLVAKDARQASPTPPPASVERLVGGGASAEGGPRGDLAVGAEAGTDVLL